MTNITLRQIRAFVAVARAGRFRAAAEALHVTQSALSMLVSELETQMGVRLFDRHTRMVQLTDAGREFLPVATRTLDDLENACGSLRELAALQRGRVRIAASTVLAGTLLPWAIQQFSLGNPGVKFVLKDVAEQDICPQVQRGEVDLGVGTSLDADSEIVERPLLRDTLTLLCAEKHPLAGRSAPAWRDLAHYPFIALGAGSPLRSLVDRALVSAGVNIEPAYEVSFSSTVISMVAAGLGVSVLPVNARQVSPRAKVEMRRLTRPTVERQVSLFMRRNVAPTPAAAAFQDFLAGYVTAAQQRASFAPRVKQ